MLAFVSHYTNIPIQLEWTWFSAGNGEWPFYSCNTKHGHPNGCDTVDHGIMFVVNERGEIERFDGAGYFDAYMAGRISYEEAEAYHVTIPINVSESDVLACGDESVRQSIEMALYYEGDYVSSFIYAEGSYSSLAEALFLCKNLGIYYKKNHTLEGFALYSSSSVNSSSAFAPNIPVSSSESTSSSSVETSSSAVSSSSVQSSSSVSASSSLAENQCVAHPMNSVPADPRSSCVSKSGKCYKCNAFHSASECASEWLWTSPRDNFESYWYSEVDCQSAAPVLAKRGAKKRHFCYRKRSNAKGELLREFRPKTLL